ncbi:hypothetical protein F5X96DRAFT_161342 [Biscogniauxia mediterranea]|nr:hypothetical protein F5X96DRAFT_161342 [Biscogniauxia mediterranea]
MHLLPSTHALAVLTSLASASHTTWTAHDVQRSKSADLTLCTWHLEIDGDSNSTSTCHFEVASPAGVDCGQEPLGDHNVCTGAGALVVGGGHSDQGFVVVVAVDEARGEQAYFGFADADLDAAVAIPAQQASVYPIGSYRSGDDNNNGSGAGAGDDGDGDGDGDKKGKKKNKRLQRRWQQQQQQEKEEEADVDAAAAVVWMVSNMYRHTDPSTHAVNISFSIHDDDIARPGLASCELNLAAPAGADLATWQWYDQKCEGSDYYASWGYLPAGDAGIMTLVNPARDSNAYFGFANINSVQDLGSAGPNPVSPCNCG